MDKQAFMQELENRLRHLTEDDKIDALEYYSEYIDDLNLPPEGDVCAHLGTPKEVARQIIAQTTERKAEEQQEKKTTKGFGSVVWLAILGIFASPIALPLAIVAVVLIIAFLIVIGSIIFSFAVAGIACVLAGAFTAVISFFAPGIAQKLIVMGCGLFVCGLGIMFLLGTRALSKLLVKMISGIIRKAAAKHSKKKNMKQMENMEDY
ncbi:MAG: DUF1700 domain-containing protein [Lachnospiraceae bacterium]|nr:DUF1700 domain-containing protein [Lachnospiraceae bacterium]